MSKKTTEPTSGTTTTEEKPKAFKQIPTQRTFCFLAITPSFIIDFFVNRWLQSLVVDKGTVPMLGKVSSGTVMVYYVYLYTTKYETTTL